MHCEAAGVQEEERNLGTGLMVQIQSVGQLVYVCSELCKFKVIE